MSKFSLITKNFVSKYIIMTQYKIHFFVYKIQYTISRYNVFESRWFWSWLVHSGMVNAWRRQAQTLLCLTVVGIGMIMPYQSTPALCSTICDLVVVASCQRNKRREAKMKEEKRRKIGKNGRRRY